MKIMHIMVSKALGGAETYSTDVILQLHARGVEQVVVMHPKAPRMAEMVAAGIRVVTTPSCWPFLFMQRYAIKKRVAAEKPDLIQCWMRRAGSLAPQHSIPPIGWFGGYYEPRYFTHCRHFVGVTRDIVAHMVRRGVAERLAHYIPTFPTLLGLGAVNRAACDTPDGMRVVVALSRLHPKKGIDTLLQAAKDVPNTMFWIAGDGPDRAKLEKMAHDLGVTDRVRFLGWRTDRAALLAAADICVLPSRYEPFGTVILEAWAARVPFVACRSVGPAQHVTDHQDGVLVDVDDAVGLARALNEVLDDHALRNMLIEQGYAQYQAHFTPEHVTDQWLEFYQQRLSEEA